MLLAKRDMDIDAAHFTVKQLTLAINNVELRSFALFIL